MKLHNNIYVRMYDNMHFAKHIALNYKTKI